MYNLDDKSPFCPYCGKRIDDKDRTVDHIFTEVRRKKPMLVLA